MSSGQVVIGDHPRVATGIAGLDDILHGGLPENRLYLITGTPGVGKTTLALQFLLEGIRSGQSGLYITLSETEAEIRQVAASHGWSLDGLHLFELSNAELALRLDGENTLYATEDVDLRETVRVLLDEVERVKPARVVFDSLSEIRLLAQTPMRYRRQLLALKQHFSTQNSTVLLLDDRTGGEHDLQIESLAHGVIALEQLPMQYGTDRRRLRVTKLRGRPFRGGYHDYVIDRGGLQVFPRLIAAEHRTQVAAEPLSSGLPSLDALLGGGLDRATTALIMGPSGTGKSVIAMQFACAAADRGEPAALFVFEERLATLHARSRALGMSLDRHAESGLVRLHQIDPAELAPDQFTHLVRGEVEKHGARVVVIDSLSGYQHAMPQARFLALQMHELLSYLAERGVASILTMTQAGMVASATMTSPVDVSYLADTVVLLRYFEADGRIRRAISVVKKRSGPHEDTIRELAFTPRGLAVGEPLTGFRGVLAGTPVPVPAGDNASRRSESEERGGE